MKGLGGRVGGTEKSCRALGGGVVSTKKLSWGSLFLILTCRNQRRQAYCRSASPGIMCGTYLRPLCSLLPCIVFLLDVSSSPRGNDQIVVPRGAFK